MPRAKKDISKDLMFQKIMPSAVEPIIKREVEQPAVSSIFIEQIEQAEQFEQARPTPQHPRTKRTALAKNDKTAPQFVDNQAELQNPPKTIHQPVIKQYVPQTFEVDEASPVIHAGDLQPLNTTQQYYIQEDAITKPDSANQLADGCRLVNLLERPVLEQLEAVLSRFNFCKCDICKREIIASTLSSLPAKYVALEEGEAPPYDKNPETVMEVTTALVRACVKIKNYPPHGAKR